MATTKTATKKRASTKRAKIASTSNRKWSQDVTQRSNALNLESGVFKKKDPKKIAQSLKRSAEHSKRKKSGPYQSAMSMLNFYINRGGNRLSKKQKEPLAKAKGELRKLYHRDED
jgi:uncharacterized protein DUF3175